MYTRVHHADLVHKRLRTLFSEYDRLRSVKNLLTLVSDDTIVVTAFQAIFKLKFNDELTMVLHDLVVSTALKAETIVPGGFHAVISSLVSQHSVDDRDDDAYVPQRSDIETIIRAHLTGSDVDLLIGSLELAGPNGRIFLEGTDGLRDHVERVEGSTFALSPAIHVTEGTYKDARVICIDGCLETVSELHTVLMQLSENVEMCFLFARLFSDEVKHTLKVNYDRGTLRVIPVVVEFDVTGANTLVDVACVAGGDVVSSFKGELISTIDVNKHPIAENVVIDKKTLTMFQPKTRLAVEQHVATLREKQGNTDAYDPYSARIKSLSTNNVYVRIRNDINRVRRTQGIDYALRAVRCAIGYGVTSDGELALLRPVSKRFSDQIVKQVGSLGAVISACQP